MPKHKAPRRDVRDPYRSYQTWDDREAEFEARPWWVALKWSLAAVVIALVCAAVVGLATTGNALFQGEAAKRTVTERTNSQTFTPENKAAQIAFFHDACNTVNAQLRIAESNEATYRADMEAARLASDPIKQQQAQSVLSADQQNVTGAQNIVQSTAADYNSRSAQSTANVFKDSGLPDRITLPAPIPAGYSVNCG